MLEHALAYLSRGWCVIPATEVIDGACSCGRAVCGSAGKHPRIAWTAYQSRRPAVEEVRRWWSRWPTANIAVVTGAISGIVALDIDPRHGGDESLADLGALPQTLTSMTGGGGQHLIFAHPGGAPVPNGANLLPGIDLRGDGGYIIAPPSRHHSGRQYAWDAITEDLPPAALPEAVARLLDGFSHNPGAGAEGQAAFNVEEILLRGVPEGRRNDTMARLAGHFLGEGKDREQALALCVALNASHFRPPLPEAEVQATVESIWRRQQRRAEIDQAAMGAVAGRVDTDQLAAGDRLAIAREVWRELGVEGVIAWRLFLSEPPVYLLETGRGEVNLADNLLSQTVVRNRLHAWLGILMPHMRTPDWEARANALRSLALVEEVESRSGDMMDDWLEAYLEEYAPREWDMAERRAALGSGPILVGDETWLRPVHLRNFIEAVFGEKLSPAQARRYLKQCGWAPGLLATAGRKPQRGWRKQ